MGPSVGIFWFVPANMFAMSALITDMTPLAEAPKRDGPTVHNLSHEEFWSTLARLSLKNLRAQGLPSSIAGAEFDTHPRGRVDYDAGQQRFTIYADRRIQDWAFMQYVVAFFDLPDDRFIITTNPDYASSQPLGPPKPWY
jgi:hypothetical protein